MVENISSHISQDGASLFQLIEAARSERWDVVDQSISRLKRNPEMVNWATRIGLDHGESSLRSLAVSILEKYNRKLRPQERKRLMEMVIKDEDLAIQYRATFALYKRGDRSEQVMAKMNEALKNIQI